MRQRGVTMAAGAMTLAGAMPKTTVNLRIEDFSSGS
jgi:hypothetical protein